MRLIQEATQYDDAMRVAGLRRIHTTAMRSMSKPSCLPMYISMQFTDRCDGRADCSDRQTALKYINSRNGLLNALLSCECRLCDMIIFYWCVILFLYLFKYLVVNFS